MRSVLHFHNRRRAASQMRMILGAGALVMVFAGLWQGASPDLSAAGTRSAAFEVSGPNDCFVDGFYSLALPARALVTAVQPTLNAGFLDAQGQEVAYVSQIRRGGNGGLRWTITSSRCLTYGPWSAGTQLFEATFRTLSKRPPLGRRLAKTATRSWLARKYPFFNDSEGSAISCRQRIARSIRKCRFLFFAGDVSFNGAARVSLFSEPNADLHARLSYRIRQTNDYCIAVLNKPRSQCTRVHRGRTRVDDGI